MPANIRSWIRAFRRPPLGNCSERLSCADLRPTTTASKNLAQVGRLDNKALQHGMTGTAWKGDAVTNANNTGVGPNFIGAGKLDGNVTVNYGPAGP